jgi:hypothetical protein
MLEQDSSRVVSSYLLVNAAGRRLNELANMKFMHAQAYVPEGS